METTLSIRVRRFPVRIHDQSACCEREDAIVLTKEQLRAAELVGQSSKELIHRLYKRKGYLVLEIGKSEKREITLDLEALYQTHSLHQMGKREVAR